MFDQTSVTMFVSWLTVCQQSKVQGCTKLHHLPLCYGMHASIKFIGPLPGNRIISLLICIDCFTRWPEAIPTTDNIAETIAHEFIQGWISSGPMSH